MHSADICPRLRLKKAIGPYINPGLIEPGARKRYFQPHRHGTLRRQGAQDHCQTQPPEADQPKVQGHLNKYSLHAANDFRQRRLQQQLLPGRLTKGAELPRQAAAVYTQ